MISVIVSCYNYGRYLADCVNSLLGGPTSLGMMQAQTVDDFEAIIVNDASTDDTAEIAAEYTKQSDKIKFVNLKHNIGTAGAFNAGIERAKGEWIFQLSADDMLESYALERYLDLQLANPHGFVYGNQQIFAFGHRLRYFFQHMQRYDFEENLKSNHIPGSMMYPKRAWQEMGGIPEAMNDGREDWATGLALGSWGYHGIYLHDSGYLYRREGQNRSTRKTDESYYARKISQIFPKLYEGYRPVA